MATRKIKTADELEAEARKLASKARAMRRVEEKAAIEAKAQVRLDLGTKIMDEIVGKNRVDEKPKGKKDADKEHADEVLVASTIIEALTSPDLVARLRGDVEKAFGGVDAGQSVADESKVEPNDESKGEASTDTSSGDGSLSDEDEDESTDTTNHDAASQMSTHQGASYDEGHAGSADTRW